MELRPIISIEDELTGGKFYRVESESDTNYSVVNNLRVKRIYPKAIFEIPGEVYTYAQVTEKPNLGRLVEKADIEAWKQTAWGGVKTLVEELKQDSSKIDSINNGGSTDYYKINPEWKDLADIIEDRDLSYNQANILKAAFTFNLGRHSGTDELRDINKIIYFAERQKALILKQK